MQLHLMKSKLLTVMMVSALLLIARAGYSYHAKGIILWPIPYYAGNGVMQFKDFSGIDFNKVRIKIYNIDGEEVYSSKWPGYPVLWSGRNSDGHRVDSGMFTVKIEAENIFNGLRADKTVRILTKGGSNGSFTGGGWAGAKYVAMGRSGEVVSDDVYSIFWNPAGLTELRHTRLLTGKEIKERAQTGKVDEITEGDLIKFSEEEKSFSLQIGVSGTKLAFGSNTGFFGMAINLPQGVLGIGFYTIYSGGIDRRDFNGYKTGDLRYMGSALYLSYGVSLGISSFGVSVKGLFEKNGNNNFIGCGADIGTQVYVLPFLKVGLMIQDLGSGMYPLENRFDTRQKYNFMYPTLRLGIAIITNRNFTLSLSGIKKLDQKSFGYSVGAQYDIFKWASVYIGMQNLVFSAGATINIEQIKVSYAFTMDTINKGFNHIISASVLF
jgi:hypothetical protein